MEIPTSMYTHAQDQEGLFDPSGVWDYYCSREMSNFEFIQMLVERKGLHLTYGPADGRMNELGAA